MSQNTEVVNGEAKIISLFDKAVLFLYHHDDALSMARLRGEKLRKTQIVLKGVGGKELAAE